MKKILLFLSFLFFVTLTFAQANKNHPNNTEPLLEEVLLFPIEIFDCGEFIPKPIGPNAPRTSEECFNQAELIFEGHRLKCVATYNTQGNKNRYDSYGIVAYKVNKVYKGDPALAGDTIYIVQHGIGLGAEKITSAMMNIMYINPYSLSKNGINGLGWKTIHFFTTSDFPENGIPEKYSNMKKYKILEKEFEDLYEYGDKILGLDDLIFHNHEDFYKYARQFEGFRIPETNFLQEEQIENKEENKTIDAPYYKTNEESKGNVKKNKKKVLQNPRGTNYILNLEIANQQKVSAGGKSYVTFDVMISQNQSTNIYFDRAYMFIKYNTAVFGSYVESNAKLTVTKGGQFNIDATTYTLERYEKGADKIGLSIFYSSQQNRVMLGTTPIPLLHVKIELLTSTSNWEQANLFFTDIASAANDCFYAVTPCANAKVKYDQVVYTPTGLPTIESLSPFLMIAGVGETLTIADATIYLYSSLSSHLKTFEHVSNNEIININNLSNGIYFLKIVSGSTIKNEKLILSK